MDKSVEKKIEAALRALERGEKPCCPRCGAAYKEYLVDKFVWSASACWECGTTASHANYGHWGPPKYDTLVCGSRCYERQLAAFAACVRELRACLGIMLDDGGAWCTERIASAQDASIGLVPEEPEEEEL